METLEKIYLAVSEASAICQNKKNVDRVKVFISALNKQGVEGVFVGDKPAKGISFFVSKMKNSVRVNVRCGYGKFNYAPCVEIKL